LYTD